MINLLQLKALKTKQNKKKGICIEKNKTNDWQSRLISGLLDMYYLQL